MNDPLFNAQYWDNRYQQRQTGWDIGYVSTPIKEYVDQLTNKEGAILIPGCGNSYEAEYLLGKGFTNVTLIDISPPAHAKAGGEIQCLPGSPAPYHHRRFLCTGRSI